MGKRIDTSMIPVATRPVAFISGASSGIGAAFARRLARDGYNLCLHGRRHGHLQVLAGEMTSKYRTAVEIITAELSDPRECARVETRLGEIENLEVVVNNAGFALNGYFYESAIKEHEDMVRVHLIAAQRFVHAALPVMRKRRRGTLITVSSVAAFTPGSGAATYCATKAFLTSFSEALALELAPQGIRVIALCPGWTRTDFHERRGIPQSSLPDWLWMKPERVVATCLRDLRWGRTLSIPGLPYKIAVFFVRHLPRPLYYAGVRVLAARRAAWRRQALQEQEKET